MPEDADMTVSVGDERVEPLTGSITIAPFEEGLSIDFTGMMNIQGSMNCLL